MLPLYFLGYATHRAQVLAFGLEAMAALPGNLASERAALLES